FLIGVWAPVVRSVCDMLDTVGSSGAAATKLRLLPPLGTSWRRSAPTLSDLLMGVPGMVVMAGPGAAMAAATGRPGPNTLPRPGMIIMALSLMSMAYGDLRSSSMRFRLCFLAFLYNL